MISETPVRSNDGEIAGTDVFRKPTFGDYKLIPEPLEAVNAVIFQLSRLRRTRRVSGKNNPNLVAFEIPAIDNRTGRRIFRGMTVDLTNPGHMQLIKNSEEILKNLRNDSRNNEERIMRFIEWLTIIE